MRFNRGEMVFNRLEIRSKATNVAEIQSKIVKGSVKIPEVVSRGAVRPGDICGSLPNGDSQAGCAEATFKF